MESQANRREFARLTLSSIAGLALLEGLGASRLFANPVASMIETWLTELVGLSKDVQAGKLTDLEFQKALEAHYAKVDLPELLATLDFERLAREVKFPEKGAKSLPGDFKGVSGLPKNLVFGRQVFALEKGRSVIPHGHDNMSTGFIVLSGTCRGRHYDRVEDHKDHYIIKPTIDRSFKPSEFSTISDHKDNVHWFTAETEHAFIFNVHVLNTDPGGKKNPGRVYVDPMGEKLSDGLIKAPKISYGKANQLYG